MMKINKIPVLLFRLFTGLTALCSGSDMPAQAFSQKKTVCSYLPLGDSYTICEGAAQSESWPVLLTAHLNEKGIAVELKGNPARTGWTSRNLIERELPVFDATSPDLVTLLIGVNDWMQGVAAREFEANLVTILDHLESRLKVKSQIIMITIPDFSVVPAAAGFHFPDDISKGITGFNAIIRAEAMKRHLALVDIFPLTQRMKGDASLVAGDGLHPSAKEYALWEKLILPVAEKMLKK